MRNTHGAPKGGWPTFGADGKIVKPCARPGDGESLCLREDECFAR